MIRRVWILIVILIVIGSTVCMVAQWCWRVLGHGFVLILWGLNSGYTIFVMCDNYFVDIGWAYMFLGTRNLSCLLFSKTCLWVRGPSLYNITIKLAFSPSIHVSRNFTSLSFSAFVFKLFFLLCCPFILFSSEKYGFHWIYYCNVDWHFDICCFSGHSVVIYRCHHLFSAGYYHVLSKNSVCNSTSFCHH